MLKRSSGRCISNELAIISWVRNWTDMKIPRKTKTMATAYCHGLTLTVYAPFNGPGNKKAGAAAVSREGKQFFLGYGNRKLPGFQIRIFRTS